MKQEAPAVIKSKIISNKSAYDNARFDSTGKIKSLLSVTVEKGRYKNIDKRIGLIYSGGGPKPKLFTVGSGSENFGYDEL